MSKIIFNSSNEWDPLKQVIVGDCTHYFENKLDISFSLFFHDNIADTILYPTVGKKKNNIKLKYTKKYLEELAEDIEELVMALEKNKIIVHRPKQKKTNEIIKTPYWESFRIPALNVRDQAIILKNTLVETAPLVRSRYFENDLLKHIFYEGFKNQGKWKCMPKPMMLDNSFDLSYVKKIERGQVATETIFKQKQNDFDCGPEIMIDAAQIIRFDKDLLINVANENHRLGLDWFKKELGSEYTFHVWDGVSDNHIDSIIMPLNQETILLRSEHFIQFLPEFLKNKKILIAPPPNNAIFPTYGEEDLILSSKFIDINVLPIGNNKIIANSLFPDLMELLSKNNFEVIPVRHRHRRLFGGGFHCFTLDLEREPNSDK